MSSNKVVLYPGIVPPKNSKKSYEEMNNAEAQEHFEWFVSQSIPRCEALREFLHKWGVDRSSFDYSPSSLKEIWPTVWRFLERLQTSGAQPSLKTAVILDMSFYFAEVFLHNFPTVHWALWKKKIGPYNRPYLAGFKSTLVPYDVLKGTAYVAIRDRNDLELYTLFLNWKKYLVKGAYSRIR